MRLAASLFRAVFIVIIGITVLSQPAIAQVSWEDYQGNNRVLGTSNQDLPGPTYPNGTGTSATRLNALRTIAGNPANAVRTGTSANINFTTANLTLCNLDNDPAGTGAACQADAQGRVLYAVIRMPFDGNYTFNLAHDDDIDLDFSTAYATTNYRSASYDVPIGSAAEFTANDTTYETLTGSVSAPTDDSCVLMRLYWNNVVGINHLRLRWTRPNATTGTTTEIIPAAQFLPPGTTTGCAGSITTTGRSLTVNKLVGSTGRAAAADQFTVSMLDGAGLTVISSATTSGTGTGQQASTGGNFVVAGTTYRITDTMAGGSANTLAAYVPAIACTLNGAAHTPTTISTATGSISVPATGTNQQFVCNITNSRASRMLQLRKTWVGAVVGNAVTLPATTGFSTNTAAFASVANTANETDTGIAVTMLTGTGTLPGELFTTGAAASYASALSCTDGTLSGTNGKADNQLTIAAAGATIVCTYSNTYLPPLTVTKTSAAFSDPVNGSTNPKHIPGAMVDYTITVASPATYTVSSNTLVVIDQLPGQISLFVNSLGSTPAGPVAYTPGTSGLTFTYSGLSSTTDDIDFSSNGGASWNYVPVPDANGVDAAITHFRIMPKGTMQPSSSFSLRIRALVE